MIDNLLSQNENRRLNLIKILAQKNDSVHLSELAKILNASVRTLKDDLAFFRNEIDDFIIESSNDGIRLYFKKNKGIKTISQKILADSLAYQLLETIFLDESLTANELAQQLFISQSTIYRVINRINRALERIKFEIQTNPCKIVGDEQMIRYFAYQYFHERYADLSWPFEMLDEEQIEYFLTLLMKQSKAPINYAYFHIVKIIFTINLFRYQRNYLIDTSQMKLKIQEMFPLLDYHSNSFKDFKDVFGVTLNNQFMKQVFTGYIQEGFSQSYEHLLEQAQTNATIEQQVNFLDNALTDFAKEQNIPLLNKDVIIVVTQNAVYSEYWDARSGYILYDQHDHFVKTIENSFPSFYKPFYEIIKQYRELIDLPITGKSVNYLVYTVFTYWTNLVPELRKKYDKINALVISDSHNYHASMLKDFLDHEYHTQLNVDIFTEIHLKKEVIEQLPYDLIVTNFPFPELTSKELVYIQNVPTYNDIKRIQSAISNIVRIRKKC